MSRTPEFIEIFKDIIITYTTYFLCLNYHIFIIRKPAFTKEKMLLAYIAPVDAHSYDLFTFFSGSCIYFTKLLSES